MTMGGPQGVTSASGIPAGPVTQKSPRGVPLGLRSFRETAATCAGAPAVNQRQVITPLTMLHTFADCECVALALHAGGGPGMSVTVTVTFCDGLKP